MKKTSLKKKSKVAKKTIGKFSKKSKPHKKKKMDVHFEKAFNSLGDSEKKAIVYYGIRESKTLKTCIKYFDALKKIYEASKIEDNKGEFNIPKAWMEESNNLITDISKKYSVTVIIIGEMFKKGILIRRPKGCNWAVGLPTMEMAILLRDKNNNDIQKSYREKVKKEKTANENQLAFF